MELRGGIAPVLILFIIMRLDIAGLCLCLIFKQIHGPVSVTFEEGIKRSLGKSLSLLTEAKKKVMMTNRYLI